MDVVLMVYYKQPSIHIAIIELIQLRSGYPPMPCYALKLLHPHDLHVTLGVTSLLQELKVCVCVCECVCVCV
jgi:hypothetical protein